MNLQLNIKSILKVFIKGKIDPCTIYFVKFSFNNVSATKCTSSGTYLKDAEKFAMQFKKEKEEIIVTMQIISEHGKEKRND